MSNEGQLLGDRCRVVLVRPQFAANIGSTARVMKNFGLRDLCLVNPEADSLSPEARKLSTHGESILRSAQQFHELGKAIADCVLVACTSARVGGLFRSAQVRTPAQAMPIVVESMNAGPFALVFGPEQSGLSNEEVTQCQYLIHIPTDEAYGALNLAQAVAICLYELRMAWLERQAPNSAREIAPFAAQDRMFLELETALRDLHFLWGENAGPLMHAVRHLIVRANPSSKEVNLLIGLARQIQWFVKQPPTAN